MEIKEMSYSSYESFITQRPAFVLGVSLSNSYFNEENIRKLVVWSLEFTDSIYIMIPDEPAVYTFLALDYSQKEAIKKARLKSNALENKCIRVINDLNAENDVQIVKLSSVMNKYYRKNGLQNIKKVYQNNLCFKNRANKTTREVLISNGITEPTEKQVGIGLEFLFKELAFICNSSCILQEENIAYVYHNTMLILKEIIEGEFGENVSCDISPNIGFLTVV